MTDQPILIRPAHLTDIDVIADHRVGMFRDMGLLPEHLSSTMHTETTIWLGQARHRSVPASKHSSTPKPDVIPSTFLDLLEREFVNAEPAH